MTRRLAFLIAVFALLGTSARAAKILALFAFPATSHFNAFQPLFEELAKRGHEVTVISPIAKEKQLLNYEVHILEDNFQKLFASDSNSTTNVFELRKLPFWFTMIFMRSFTLQNCEMTLSQPTIQKLIHSPDLQFDLILYEPFFVQCTYGILHKFKAPSIQLVPNTLMPWKFDPMGNPSTLSYVPSIFSSSEDVDFVSRISNCILENYLTFFQNVFVVPQMEHIMRKYFSDPTLPSIRELEESASFMFLHSNPLITHPRPLTPNTIEVGGLHIKPGNKLSKNLRKFLDDSSEGVVYFSLGSNVRSVDLPEQMRNEILKSFSKLKQNVLWKWEDDSLPGQPPNVHLEKWLPQHDVLAHSNVKLFITHGGLFSLQEAVYFGKPLIIIPVGGDQKLNADVSKNRGLGVILSVENITEESLDWALQEVLKHSRYAQAAQQLSKIFRDQPETPMERAIFWIEYTLRHKGASHLRSAALDLNFFQYYLLDVIAFLSLVIFSSILMVIFLGRLIMRRLFSKHVENTKNENFEKKRN